MIKDSNTPLTGMLSQHLQGDIDSCFFFLFFIFIEGEVIVATIAHIGKSMLNVEDGINIPAGCIEPYYKKNYIILH